MKLYSIVASLLVMFVAACDAPKDIAYCEKLGVTPTHPEYDQCLDYFARQEAWFFQDRTECNLKADETYPHTLYDRGRYDYIHSSFGVARVGSGMGVGLGPYHGGRILSIPPDHRKNQLVDELRLRIIKPCMQEKGWRSPHSWEPGRFKDAEAKKPDFTKKPKQSSNLPWLSKGAK